MEKREASDANEKISFDARTNERRRISCIAFTNHNHYHTMSTALDKRRINGPDRVFQPIFSRIDADDAAAAGPSGKGKGRVNHRVDRTNDQVRPMCEWLGVEIRISRIGLSLTKQCSSHSPPNETHPASQWLSIHRMRLSEDCMCSVWSSSTTAVQSLVQKSS